MIVSCRCHSTGSGASVRSLPLRCQGSEQESLFCRCHSTDSEGSGRSLSLRWQGSEHKSLFLVVATPLAVEGVDGRCYAAGSGVRKSELGSI